MKHFTAKKSLGQHFLTDARVVSQIVNAGEVKRGDLVLEIGPGTGVLTKALLEKGAVVTAIEADKRAITLLNETFKKEIKKKKLILIHDDIRTVNIDNLDLRDHGYKLIANIPYYITGQLFRRFLESKKQPELLVFLVQKEVGERIARSKKESLLSLSVKAYGKPEYVATVKKGSFTPQPSVLSCICKVSVISRSSFCKVNVIFFFQVLKAGFSSKRKQLIGNLKDMAPKKVLEEIFSTLNIRLDVRAEDVHIENWFLLAEMLHFHKRSTDS